MKTKVLKFDLSKLVFWVAAILFILILGGEIAKRHMQPWVFYEEGYRAAKAMLMQSLETRPWIVEKERYTGDGVIKYEPALAYNGYTLMQGWFKDGTELRLIDMKGNLVHRWRADFFSIWQHPKHVIPDINIPANRFHFHIQGMWMLPDGSVVFNFANLGTVKMDKCGKLVWKVDRMTHHSITPNADGSFWIPANGDVRKVPEDLMLFGVTRESLMTSSGAYEDRLLLVNADGTIRKEISVLRALIDGGFEHELFDMSRHSRFDPTHVNDIEVVTPALAAKIEGVNEGDLLISIRQLHMLAILDKDSGKIKWHHSGPWVRQHDPDITEDGNIEVLNNHPAMFSPTNRNHNRYFSNIISYDPASNKTAVLYKGVEQANFYTEIQGTHQILGNGNRMIVESKGGRIFELDKSGRIVWEYISRYDNEYASMIEHGIRFNKQYFTLSNWSCS